MQKDAAINLAISFVGVTTETRQVETNNIFTQMFFMTDLQTHWSKTTSAPS